MAGRPPMSLTEWLSSIMLARSGIHTTSTLASSRSMYRPSICSASASGRAIYRRRMLCSAIKARRCSRPPRIG
ncbi:hypothetical protein D3C84_1069620 [compost metagenome]